MMESICHDRTHEKWREMLELRNIRKQWWVIQGWPVDPPRVYSTHRLRRHARGVAKQIRAIGVKATVRQVHVHGAYPPRRSRR